VNVANFTCDEAEPCDILDCTIEEAPNASKACSTAAISSGSSGGMMALPSVEGQEKAIICACEVMVSKVKNYGEGGMAMTHRDKNVQVEYHPDRIIFMKGDSKGEEIQFSDILSYRFCHQHCFVALVKKSAQQNKKQQGENLFDLLFKFSSKDEGKYQAHHPKLRERIEATTHIQDQWALCPISLEESSPYMQHLFEGGGRGEQAPLEQSDSPAVVHVETKGASQRHTHHRTRASTGSQPRKRHRGSYDAGAYDVDDGAYDDGRRSPAAALVMAQKTRVLVNYPEGWSLQDHALQQCVLLVVACASLLRTLVRLVL
jgi:hypothetical protein